MEPKEMQPLKSILREAGFKTAASPPSTDTAIRPRGCWCGGKGGKFPRYLPVPGQDAVELYEVVCSCPEGIAHEALKVRYLGTKAEREEQKIRSQLWKAAGIPARFEDYTLDNSPLAKLAPHLVAALRFPPCPVASDDERWGSEETPEMEAWQEASNRWAESWFLWGPYGTGKTGLAVGYARQWLRHEWGVMDGGKILFRTVPKLLSEMRSTYNRDKDSETPTEAELVAEYAGCALLVLDDLGAEQVKNTGWVEDRLYQIIGERHDNMKPMVFTSNLDLKGVAARIGERVTWRIAEMCGESHMLHVNGPNLRGLP